MKKIVFAFALGLLLYFNAYKSVGQGFCQCGGLSFTPLPDSTNNNGVWYNINYGDTFNLNMCSSVNNTAGCISCSTQIAFGGSGNFINDSCSNNCCSYQVTDSGTYWGHFNCGNTYCGYAEGTTIIHVEYILTGILELNSDNVFQLIPTISSGLFQIKTKEQLKKIFITDDVGRIVYSSSIPVSEINISNVAAGIYFYAIEDEKERVWRGKIVKE